MTYTPALASIVLVVAIGFVLLHRIGLTGRVHVLLAWGTAYGAGLALVSFVIAVMSLLSIPLELVWGLVGVLLAVGGCWLLTRRVRTGDTTEGTPTRPLRRVSWVFVVVLAVLVAKAGAVSIRAMDKPVMGWDAGSTHSLRAKAIFHEERVSRATLEWVGGFDYPLGIPLLEVWVAWFQGEWDDTVIKILFPGFLVAILAMVYGALRDVYGPMGSLGGASFMAGMPLLMQHATDAYLDLPLAYTTLGISLFLWRFARKGLLVDLAVASLMAAFGVWIKREGSIIFGIAVVIVAVLVLSRRERGPRRMAGALMAFAVLPVCVWGAWATFCLAANQTLPLSFQPSSGADLLSRAAAVVGYTIQDVWTSRNWNVLWSLFFGMWLLNPRKGVAVDALCFAWPVVLTIGVFLAVSATTEMGDYLRKGSTLHRILLHVVPLAVMFVALRLPGELRLAGDAVPGRRPTPPADEAPRSW